VPFPFERKDDKYVGWAFVTYYGSAGEVNDPGEVITGPVLEGSPEGGVPFPFERKDDRYVGWAFVTTSGSLDENALASVTIEATGGLAWTPLRMDAIAKTRIVSYSGSPCAAMVAFTRVDDFRKDGQFVGSTAWKAEDYCGDDKTANAKTSAFGWVYGHSWSMTGEHKAEENGVRVWGVVETSASKDL
jgi:hypothetical protein